VILSLYAMDFSTVDDECEVGAAIVVENTKYSYVQCDLVFYVLLGRYG
jgi:hypothetical protein